MRKKYQVFVSSTFTDMKDERQAAVEAILKASHIPAGMELFAAGSKSQMEIIKRWIEESDIYMLILGGRYGSIEKESKLSYIELEYDYAASIGKPIFSVVITEEALDKKIKENGKSVIETDYPEKYKDFKEKVLRRICSFYQDKKDIKLAVHESLPEIEHSSPLNGWISSSDVPDTQSLLNEIQRLSDENKKTLTENERLKLLISKGDNENEYWNELIQTLKEKIVEMNVFNENEKTEKKKYSVLEIFWSLRAKFITGIYNEYNMTPKAKFLFFNVCPTLQIHGLMENEKVAGVAYRRYAVSKRGTEFLAYLEKNKIFPKNKSDEIKDVPAKKVVVRRAKQAKRK